MDITKKVAKARYFYHLNMLDVSNVLNQLGILSDEKAEKMSKKHAMATFDCMERMERMGYNLDMLKSDKES